MLNKVYWCLHATVTWAVGLGLILVAGSFAALHGKFHWLHVSLGMLIIVTGEVARRTRLKPAAGSR